MLAGLNVVPHADSAIATAVNVIALYMREFSRLFILATIH